MSEADWWLCGHCQSLNNLSARKCYSCAKRKPRDTVRASEYLGYVPVIDENGKVALEDIPPPDVSQRPDVVGARRPPLRDPILRDTLAVAPRPPAGARITYRPLPPVPPMPTVPPPQQASPLPPMRPLPPPPPPGPGPWGPPGPLVAMGPGPPPAAAALPLEAPPIPIPGQTERWAHWSDLLDVPRPAADRLRASYALDHATQAARDGGAASNGSASLSQRLKVVRVDEPDGAGGLAPWPENDRPIPRPAHSPSDR